MTSATGVPTGLSPTAGVDYSIPLPYDVPSITANRVGYYFAASTIGDAYRKAVAGNAESYAWIQASATIPDSTFAAAFSEVPGQLTIPMMRDWFSRALAALESPSGSSFQGAVNVTPEGAATITSRPLTEATAPSPPDVSLSTTKTVAAQLAADQPIAVTGLPEASQAAAPAASALPTWVKWAAALAGLLLLIAFLRKAS